MRALALARPRLRDRMYQACVVASVAVVTAMVTTAAAAPPPKQFLAVLNAPQETPPLATAGNGAAHLTFEESTKMLCFSINFQNLSSAEILAHIHGPALPGTPAGILFPLPLGNPKAGCVGPLDKNQKNALLKNSTYINIHSANFPAGEIRGQILRIK